MQTAGNRHANTCQPSYGPQHFTYGILQQWSPTNLVTPGMVGGLVDHARPGNETHALCHGCATIPIGSQKTDLCFV
jgi:hypothetical protein